jgi:hypothetical protein
VVLICSKTLKLPKTAAFIFTELLGSSRFSEEEDSKELRFWVIRMPLARSNGKNRLVGVVRTNSYVHFKPRMGLYFGEVLPVPNPQFMISGVKIFYNYPKEICTVS